MKNFVYLQVLFLTFFFNIKASVKETSTLTFSLMFFYFVQKYKIKL